MNVKIGNMRKILCLALCLGMPFLAWAQQDTLTYERDITLTEAIALAKVPGATASDLWMHLDHDDGRQVYEGSIYYNSMEYEFTIDAYSGAILEWDSESIYD